MKNSIPFTYINMCVCYVCVFPVGAIRLVLSPGRGRGED